MLSSLMWSSFVVSFVATHVNRLSCCPCGFVTAHVTRLSCCPCGFVAAHVISRVVGHVVSLLLM